MTLFNVIKNDEVVAIYVSDDIDLVPCAENEIVEIHNGEYHVGWKKVNNVWLSPDDPNYPK